MSTPTLTPKQRQFAELLVSGGLTQADCYRRVYDVKPTTSPDNIAISANRVANYPQVKAFVAELRKEVTRQIGVSLEDHLAKLAELRDRADGASKFGPAVNAEVARGKACGLYIERTEVVDKTPREKPDLSKLSKEEVQMLMLLTAKIGGSV